MSQPFKALSPSVLRVPEVDYFPGLISQSYAGIELKYLATVIPDGDSFIGGSQAYGDPISFTVDVFNSGQGIDINVSDVVISDDVNYTLVSYPLTPIAPGDTASIVIQFNASSISAGSFPLSIVVTSDGPTSPYTVDTSYEQVGGGIVGWWKIDEGSGTAIADSSANGLTGATYNGPTWATGHTGSNDALQFNGSTQYIQGTTSDSILAFSTDFTLCAWIKTSGLGDMGIFARVDNSDQGYLFGMAGGHLRLFAGGYKNAVGNIADGNWHFVAVVVTASSTKFYVDGALTTTAGGVSSLVPGVFTWRIAAINYNNISQLFNGAIEDVRAYGIPLSATEVLNIYNTGNP